MSFLPNSHEALLRNQEQLPGSLALIGSVDPGLLAALPAAGVVITDHAGLYASYASAPGWVSAFGFDDPILTSGSADTAVIFLPKARSELSLRLDLAQWLVVEGGRVILVGEKKEGIAGGVKQLRAALPQAEKIDSARHCQVWQADSVSQSGSFKLEKWLTWHSVERAEIQLDVAGLPGIFSDGELDEGTGLLLDTLAANPIRKGAVLDFACGAGVIGAWLQQWQRLNQQAVSSVDCVDVQAQAVRCARATYERAGASGNIVASDGLAGVEGRYQTILSNPPFHTGVRTDTSMTESFLQSASKHLVSGGELRIVANRFLPYEALIQKHVGKPVVMQSNSRFTVWSALRR